MNAARRIFLYNWPLFLSTWAVALALGAVALCFQQWLLLVACGTALAWSLLALAVSVYVYDVSSLASGEWIISLLPGNIQTWAALDAGLDGEVALEPNVTGACIGRLQLIDSDSVQGGSIRRAQRVTARRHAGIACKPTHLPLMDASCDALFVAFAAHEVKPRAARERLFSELARVLKPNGSLLLIEHVRDIWNFAAFGLGAFHFLARREWLSLAADAGFRVRTETRVTRLVMALVLEKPI